MRFCERIRDKKIYLCVCLSIVCIFINGCGIQSDNYGQVDIDTQGIESTASNKSEKGTLNDDNTITSVSQLSQVPDYSGYAYIEINGNCPFFSSEDKKNTNSFETYSNLDSLGRCGVAYANICQEIQPSEERGAIGSVKPSGWHTVKYNDIIDGNYLYNRCHLIGYQLAGENANEKNLITGTRYLNVVGMLPFENKVDEYVDSTNNHVLYRVTPYFEGNNLVANGVLMEAWSVEDSGKGICFNVYCYNVQPGIEIDYSNGDSKENSDIVSRDDDSTGVQEGKAEEDDDMGATIENASGEVWLSASGTKYHSINNCGRMNPETAIKMSEEEAIKKGMSKCSKCW